jgi:hypothetical protein
LAPGATVTATYLATARNARCPSPLSDHQLHQICVGSCVGGECEWIYID